MDIEAEIALKTVLLVDDVDDCRIATKLFLTSSGFVVDSVRSAEEGLAVFDPVIHDLVVTDNSMPGMTGSEMAHIIKLRSASTPVVMYTGRPPEDRSCVDAMIERPINPLALRQVLDRLLSDRPARSAVHKKS
jgi:CheY-like chemotaxis protein